MAQIPSPDCKTDSSANAPAPAKKVSPSIMKRIQRDLNSRSASLRLRAIRALKTQTNSPYAIAAYDEEDTSEEIFKEVMRNVVVYVEVRSVLDKSKTETLKEFITSLGVKVNAKLYQNTTHVIFENGLMSTYKQAKQWNIPVVSPLWMEKCQQKEMVCDPKEFPIDNEDQYEFPQLFGKVKRMRYNTSSTPKASKKVY